MKANLEFVRIDVKDIVTASVPCAVPGLPLSMGGNEPDVNTPGDI